MQLRAEVTRRKILDTAVELFERAGYANVALTDLIKRSGVTQGAFYYHFENRDAVVNAIIGETGTRVVDIVVQALSDPQFRTVENYIRSIFIVADTTAHDALVRIGLTLVSPTHKAPNYDGYTQLTRRSTDVVSAGIAEGDLRADLNPPQAGHTLCTAILGTFLHCTAAGNDLHARLADVLHTMMAALCTPDSLPHYAEFITTQQHSPRRLRAQPPAAAR